MNIASGLLYNLKGLWLGLRTPGLLVLGLIRFGVVVVITLLLTGLVLVYHQQILLMIWSKPQSLWIVWLWHLVSWLLSLLLIGLSAVVSYIISQLLFSVWLMDLMSRMTEKRLTGSEEKSSPANFFTYLGFLVSQELPRAVVPIMAALLIMILGWFTPLGPVLTLVGPAVAVIFLAWDNTDLIPARRLVPFKARFGMLLKSLPFHLGFGLPFLIPVLNILLLSFAPVGATLYQVEKKAQKPRENPANPLHLGTR
jgi:CysZ protein